MTKPFQTVVLAGCVLIGASAILLTRAHTAPVTHACLAIGSGVCLSGTTEWVARAAATPPSTGNIMVAMVGDAN